MCDTAARIRVDVPRTRMQMDTAKDEPIEAIIEMKQLLNEAEFNNKTRKRCEKSIRRKTGQQKVREIHCLHAGIISLCACTWCESS